MSRGPARALERIRRFGERFVHPWVAGGDAWVGPPLAPGLLADWRALEAIDPDALAGTRAAIVDATRLLAPGAPAPWPERGAAALALAIHDLLWTTDPASARWPARRAVPRVEGWARALVEAVDVPRTRGEALARHAVVDRLFAATRRDVVVHTWAGIHRFPGRPVPARVVAWPRLRGVRRDEAERPVAELLAARPDARGRRGVALRALARRSPLTALVRGDVLGAPALDGPALSVLADDRLRGGVARALLARPRAALAALSAALGEAPADPEALAPALALAFELHAAAALGPEPNEPFGAPVLDALLPALLAGGPTSAWRGPLAPVDEAAVRARAQAVGAAVGARARAAARRLAGPTPSPGPTVEMPT